jgi:uncharacterized protein YbaA (DUF1428 family)
LDDNIFYAALFLPSAAAVLIFFMKYVAAIVQAMARRATDEAYREIATKAADAQAESSAALLSVSTTPAEIQSRLAMVERILKDVD